MAIINGERFTKKEKIKAVVSKEVLENIKAYCEWSDIDDLGFFIEEAACFVFSKDKDWKEHQRSIKRAKKQAIVNG